MVTSLALVAIIAAGILHMVGASNLALRVFTFAVLITILAPALERLFSVGGK